MYNRYLTPIEDDFIAVSGKAAPSAPIKKEREKSGSFSLSKIIKSIIPDFDGDIFTVLVAAILLLDCDEDELPVLLLLIILIGL